ncbi:MAG: SDR family oxidoreductase [Methanobacteriota archaeon]|nr:MAG: SDR family oxidoreductase [Euryarchaeota archaeon]
MAVEEEVKDLSRSLRRDGVDFEDWQVLVTGGAGFLGSWVCDVLLEQGARVTCVDNLVSGREENIGHLTGDRFRFVKHDISRPIVFDTPFDLVIHMASRASPFEFTRHPIQILKANTLGIWVALGIAKKHGSRFLYTSTSEVYGNPDPGFVPTPESYHGNVNPLGPRGCYDEAKRAGEAFVTAYHTQHGLDTRMVRIFNTYGPRMRGDDIYGRVVPRFIDQALSNKPITVFGDGTQTRSFTYVTDQINGILRLAAKEDVDNPVVNIGSNRETSIIDLARLIIRLTGSDSEITFHPLPEDDPLRRCPDITRARELLGWEPKVGLEEGLRRFIEHVK